jgi:hypothetical protein
MMNESIKTKRTIVAGALAALFLLIGIPGAGVAQNNWMFFNDNEVEATFDTRFQHDDVEFAMTTRAGTVDMGIDGELMIIQFTDRFFENLKADITEGEEEYEFVQSIKVAISSGVTDLLDRGLYIPVSEIAEASFENGKIVLIDQQGEEFFGELEVDDAFVMEDFRRRDARRFVNILNEKIGG